MGVKYEQKIHEHLSSRYATWRYFPQQWWQYGQGDSVRYCQTDGILYRPEEELVLLLEVKYSHTAAAYWQVENLYLPVLREFFRPAGLSIATCEVVKWYDAAVAHPCKITLRDSLEKVRPGEYAVHILNRP